MGWIFHRYSRFVVKRLNNYVADHAGDGNDVITANEGAALALASGFIGSGKISLVYLQNSGLGIS